LFDLFTLGLYDTSDDAQTPAADINFSFRRGAGGRRGRIRLTGFDSAMAQKFILCSASAGSGECFRTLSTQHIRGHAQYLFLLCDRTNFWFT
jgi:hypothetical protein